MARISTHNAWNSGACRHFRLWGQSGLNLTGDTVSVDAVYGNSDRISQGVCGNCGWQEADHAGTSPILALPAMPAWQAEMVCAEFSLWPGGNFPPSEESRHFRALRFCSRCGHRESEHAARTAPVRGNTAHSECCPSFTLWLTIGRERDNNVCGRCGWNEVEHSPARPACAVFHASTSPAWNHLCAQCGHPINEHPAATGETNPGTTSQRSETEFSRQWGTNPPYPEWNAVDPATLIRHQDDEITAYAFELASYAIGIFAPVLAASGDPSMDRYRRHLQERFARILAQYSRRQHDLTMRDAMSELMRMQLQMQGMAERTSGIQPPVFRAPEGFSAEGFAAPYYNSQTRQLPSVSPTLPPLEIGMPQNVSLGDAFEAATGRANMYGGAVRFTLNGQRWQAEPGRGSCALLHDAPAEPPKPTVERRLVLPPAMLKEGL